jgi:hypothetical protein
MGLLFIGPRTAGGRRWIFNGGRWWSFNEFGRFKMGAAPVSDRGGGRGVVLGVHEEGGMGHIARWCISRRRHCLAL